MFSPIPISPQGSASSVDSVLMTDEGSPLPAQDAAVKTVGIAAAAAAGACLASPKLPAAAAGARPVAPPAPKFTAAQLGATLPNKIRTLSQMAASLPDPSSKRSNAPSARSNDSDDDEEVQLVPLDIS